MGFVIFDGKKIQPAPLAAIEKSFFTAEDGTILGSNYNIVLNGTVLPHKGSPNSSGIFWDQPGYPPDENIDGDSRLGAILRKQKALRELFNKDSAGKLLEIQSDDASLPMKCNATIQSIVFEDDIWFSYCRYSIALTTPQISPFEEEFDSLIQSATDSWSIEQNEDPINLNNLYSVKVSHNVSATGRIRYNSNGTINSKAWEEARRWCLDRAGYNSSIVSSTSGALSIPVSYTPYNHLRSELIDEMAGSYSLSETWTLSPSSAIEDFSVSIQKSVSEPFINVSIEGSIQGLEIKDSGMVITTSKYDSASGYFASIQNNIFTRAQTYAGVTLNPLPVSESVGKNPLAGNITYSYDYNTRPSSIISGAIYENIVITINDRSDKFAAIPVLGRPDGPVLQPLNTSDEKRKSLAIECLFGGYNPADLATSFRFPEEKFTTIKDFVDPINNGARKSFLNQPQKTWEPLTGRASVTYEWTYE